MITFEKKSKIKFALTYLGGMLSISMIMTLFYMYEDASFFSEILYNVENIWKWYTLFFMVLYAIRIIINKINTKKLNEVLNMKK